MMSSDTAARGQAGEVRLHLKWFHRPGPQEGWAAEDAPRDGSAPTIGNHVCTARSQPRNPLVTVRVRRARELLAVDSDWRGSDGSRSSDPCVPMTSPCVPMTSPCLPAAL
jgi:hypothetical protein